MRIGRSSNLIAPLLVRGSAWSRGWGSLTKRDGLLEIPEQQHMLAGLSVVGVNARFGQLCPVPPRSDRRE